MRFSDYLRSKAVTLCFLGIGALLLAVFMAFAQANLSLIFFAELFLLIMVLLWTGCTYWLERRRLEQLSHLQDQLKEKYLLGELLPPPSGALERGYFSIMKHVSRSAIGIVEQASREKEEYCSYVESWIHEIKTPLTACSLILANDGDPRKLRQELKRADNLTESILYYARMRSSEKDLQIREFHIAPIMDEAVRSQMELLIAARIRVELEGDFTVYTDGKSVEFILKQLLINCAKYCPGCLVSMHAQQGVLTVEDNGPGIASHEIRRITERGFTGESGRRLGSSTGMGLYIVSQLCAQLGIGLSIESQVGLYTRISLSFPL